MAYFQRSTGGNQSVAAADSRPSAREAGGSRSPRRTIFGNGAALTREELREELQAFASEALTSSLEEHMDRMCDELKQFMQDWALRGQGGGGSDTVSHFEAARRVFAQRPGSMVPLPHAWLIRGPTRHGSTLSEDDWSASDKGGGSPAAAASSTVATLGSGSRPRVPGGSRGLPGASRMNLGTPPVQARVSLDSAGAGSSALEGAVAKVPTFFTKDGEVLKASGTYTVLDDSKRELVMARSERAPILDEEDMHEPIPEEGGRSQRRYSSRELGLSSLSMGQAMHSRVMWLVTNQTFDHIIGSLILVNCILLGVETNFHATNLHSETPKFLKVMENVFCATFTTELVMKLCAFRLTFFWMPGWQWNIFDLVVVSLQLVEQFSYVLVDFAYVRVLRILRLIRITRLIRVFRLIQELRTIASSVMSSMKPLCCSLVILVLMIYTCSVMFTQIVTDAVVDGAAHSEALQYWFGGLCRTALTMFETILGGISWDEVVNPLIVDISPVAGFIFCCYVAFCVFALMNVVTGVFVEKATQTAAENNDQYLAKHISDLFFRNTEKPMSVITWETFRSKLGSPDMQEYFKAINVDPSEAQGLFQLLDVDGLGEVDSSQIVSGLLRLRGNAKALELSLLMHETSRMHLSVTEQIQDLQKHVRRLMQFLSAMQKEQQGAEGTPASRLHSAGFKDGASPPKRPSRPSGRASLNGRVVVSGPPGSSVERLGSAAGSAAGRGDGSMNQVRSVDFAVDKSDHSED